MKNKIVIILLFPALISIPSTSNAAKPSVIKGKITDNRNHPLAYANVFIVETLEGTISDAEGNFTFTCKKAGRFTLTCSYIGYKKFVKSINVTPGKTIQINISLKPEAIKMKGLVVTASSFTAADKEGVTLTSMDVIRTPGTSADVFWAVKSFPGLQQVEEGAGLFVRGGDVSETAVYLDGAMINHPYKYESPTGGFFGTFSPFLLKGTYFSSGGYSAKYGNALSGVLAMESQDIPLKRIIGIGAGLAAESAYIAVPVKKNKLGFSFSGNLSDTKLLFKLNQSKKNFSQYPESFDLNFNTVFKPNPNTKLKLFLFRQDDKIGVEVDDPDYSTYFHGDGSNRLYNLQLTTLAFGKFLIHANAAISDFIHSSLAGMLNINTNDRLIQSRINAEYIVNSGLTLRAGFEFLQLLTKISGTVPLTEDDFNPDASYINIDTDYKSSRFAGFAECEYITPFGFILIPGIRAEKESLSDQNSIDPRISAILPLTANINLTAAFGTYNQIPRAEYFDPYAGNPHLKAMHSSHAILGFVYKKKDKIFRIETYYKNYSDLILKDQTLNYTNKGEGFARGIDLFVKNRIGNISGWISYSFLKARRKWMDLPVPASPYFDITNNLTAVVTADLPHHLSAGMSFRYATGKPYTPGPGLYNTERVPPYEKIDINLSWIHSFFGNDMTVVYAAVSNLLGRINVFDYKYSSDFQCRAAVKSSFGRSFYFGFQINLN